MKTPYAVPLALLVAACGGNVVVDQPGATASTGSGGGSTTTTTGTTTTTTVTTGTGLCSSHAQCPEGVCIFTTGMCAQACESESCDSCTPGTVCEPCATSGCPKCNDCLAACVPKQPSRCDDDDPCPVGRVCLFTSHTCAQACSFVDMECGGFAFCQGCVTSSCCGCKDCVAACVGGE